MQASNAMSATAMPSDLSGVPKGNSSAPVKGELHSHDCCLAVYSVGTEKVDLLAVPKGTVLGSQAQTIHNRLYSRPVLCK